MIPYIGGKSRIADWIISLFPEHTSYVEVFGGAGWVLHSKEPSAVEVYNDIDKDLIKKYDTPDAFFYLDPPYIKSDYYYCVNWKPEDHERLAKLLLQIKGKFALSYYDSDFVRQLYPGCYFSTKDVRVSVQHHTGHGKMKETELVVTNYEPPCPVEQITVDSLLQESEVSA